MSITHVEYSSQNVDNYLVNDVRNACDLCIVFGYSFGRCVLLLLCSDYTCFESNFSFWIVTVIYHVFFFLVFGLTTAVIIIIFCQTWSVMQTVIHFLKLLKL